MTPRPFYAALLALLVLSGTCLANPITYKATLSGAAEAVPNASPGVGAATLVYDDLTHDLLLTISFSGLLGPTTASHIHAATALPFAGTASVATATPTFPGFPTGVMSGSYSSTLDLDLLSSFNPVYVSAHGGTAAMARTDFLSALDGGKAYLNIHTSEFPGGEIRGFIVRVPDTGLTLILLGGALSLIGWLSRFRRRE